MATVSQPGSRSALLTALVIFVILFFVSAIFAVMKMAEAQTNQDNLEKRKKAYDEVITGAESTTELPALLEQLRKEPGYSPASVFSILKRQRDELTKKITGQAVGFSEATGAAAKAISSAAASAKVAVPEDALINAVVTLADGITARERQIADLKKQLTDKQAELKQQQEVVEAVNKQLKTLSDESAKRVAETQQTLEAYRKRSDARVADIETGWNGSVSELRKTIEDLTSQIETLAAENGQYKMDFEKAVKTVERYRPKNYADAILRRPSGKIIQVSRNSVAYIDLGYGQHVTTGMTFQIYDRVEGIPRVESGSEEQPPGKGSLEIVRVGPNSSECRVLKLEEGQVLQEGDIIANVVYDRNTPLRFKVFGDFDLDHNGVATEREGEVLKRLITQWGGTITDKTDIDTDFLVLGSEPSVPTFTADELQNNPLSRFAYDTAQTRLKEYDDVRDAALSLNIPVLNHNRFLYMVGYWDQGAR
jgi:hypothetical protein